MRLAGWGVLVTGFVLSACLDGTPITFPQDASAEGGVDAEVDGDTDVHAACRDCVTGTSDAGVGCKLLWDPCGTDERCVNTVLCAMAAGCLALPIVSEVVTCGTPCAQEAGIFRVDDPAVSLLLPLIDCALKECRALCQ